MPQVLLGWKYGDCVDEKAKIHPQLRTYKSLTEKVQNAEYKVAIKLKVEASGLSPQHHFSLCASGERDLQMAN